MLVTSIVLGLLIEDAFDEMFIHIIEQLLEDI